MGVYGGGGNDTLNFGVTNLTSEITSFAFFGFDGQTGVNTYNINNFTNPNAFTYSRSATGFVAISNGLGAYYPLYDANVQLLQFNAGPAGDAFYVDVVASGSQVVVNAGAGLDGLVLGVTANTLENIQGPVTYNAGVGGGNMAVYDTADTTGDTIHLDQTSLGAFPGDNLFGLGGSLQFNNIVNYAGYPGIALNLGSGADTIYAQPLPTGRVSIVANNPTSAPGDKLTLALAQALNYVITGTTNGNVTSTNLQTLDWTGIETLVAPDAVAPTVNVVDVTPDPRTTSVTSIAIDFSEAVTGFSLADLALARNGGANLLPSSATLVSADQIHWTLGNLSGLTGISGSYLLTLTAAGSGIADVAGNPLIVSATDAWTANITAPPGDANGDGIVNIFDINLVSANWGTAGPAGDANHDGVVNIFDINLVSANWTPPGGGGGGGGGSVADDGASALSSLRVANAAAEPTTDSHSASRILISAAADSRLPSIGNLNAMLANWGAGGATETASDTTASRAAVDLLWRSNAGRQNTTYASTTASARFELSRPLSSAALHSVRATRHVTAVDAVFQQSRLADWDKDLLNKIGL